MTAAPESSLQIDVFSIFPEAIDGFCSYGLLGKAREAGLVTVRVHDLRSQAGDPRRSVDDAPFGGGAGMVLLPGPIFDAVESCSPPRPLLLLGPAGRLFNQEMARELAEQAASGSGGFSLLCGRYEGVDQRVVDHLVDGEVSIGDYVLAGGEAAALAVIEAVTRLMPGVMGNDASLVEESFADGLLEYPQYTRPSVFRGWAVPDVLLSGDHGKVACWRRAQAIMRTIEVRPDLIEARGGLSPDEVRLIRQYGYAGDLPPQMQGP